MNSSIGEQLIRLYPDIQYEDQEYVETIIGIALTIAENDELDSDKLALGAALLTLDILYPSHSEDSVMSRTIGGVSETYWTTYAISKWKRLYDMLRNGTYDSSIALYYDGI